MNGVSQLHQEETNRVKKLLTETRDKPPAERLAALEAAVKERVAIRELMLQESFSAVFGNGAASVDFVGEDPRFDDGEVWDEVGYNRGGGSRFSRRGRRLTLHGLDHAREIGRWLSVENEYVIGSMNNRVAYTVGEGVVWSVVPKHGHKRDKGLIRIATDALERFRDQEDMDSVEQEHIWRQDRDGESLLRMFVNADGPPRVRFAEPEDLQPPSSLPGEILDRELLALSLGVKVVPGDLRAVEGYFMRQGSAEAEPDFVPAESPMGIRLVHHAKLNVMLNDPRGWPTYWPIRKNVARAEKLLRNMSYVASLQAAIALIRKHESGSKSDVETFLDAHKHLTVTNNATGQKKRFTKFGPGTVVDAGPGINYEAPVSSVNAANNVSVLGADLGASAAAVNQPRFMFSGEASGGYAAEMVAEGPPHKNFRRMQSRNRRGLRKIYEDFLLHEVFWDRLPPAVLHELRLEGEFPETQVRDQLQTTQRRQILHGAGVLSRQTWGSLEGLNPTTEQKNLDDEAAAGMKDPRRDETEAGEKPPAGSTDGGPGGSDYQGNPDSPETTATETF